MIQHISAMTFAVRDMARSVEFYKKLGFELLYGGEHAAFSSVKAGEAFVNLSADPRYEHRRVVVMPSAMPANSSSRSSRPGMKTRSKSASGQTFPGDIRAVYPDAMPHAHH